MKTKKWRNWNKNSDVWVHIYIKHVRLCVSVIWNWCYFSQRRENLSKYLKNSHSGQFVSVSPKWAKHPRSAVPCHEACWGGAVRVAGGRAGQSAEQLPDWKPPLSAYGGEWNPCLWKQTQLMIRALLVKLCVVIPLPSSACLSFANWRSQTLQLCSATLEKSHHSAEPQSSQVYSSSRFEFMEKHWILLPLPSWVLCVHVFRHWKHQRLHWLLGPP